MNWEKLMENLLKACLALAAGMSSATAGAVDWLEIAAAPTAWANALGVANKQRVALVLDAPAQTQLRGFMPPMPLVSARSENELHAQVSDFFKTAAPEVALKIDWLATDGPVANFKRSINFGHGLARSTYRIGETTITRTVVAAREDDTVLIHFLADKPGALSFRVSLSAPVTASVRIENRRQLILTPPAAAAASLAAHVWVLPFESEVTPEGQSITVRGEGEALILWNFGPANATTDALTDPWLKLGQRYDPGHFPPAPTRIWQGILETQCKSAAISP